MHLKELVPSFSDLMGVKAVFSRTRGTVGVMCFAERADSPQDPSYYSTARSVAERAKANPYFVTIGGGSSVLPEYKARVVEVVKATSCYGLTSALVKDPATYELLKQWPVSVVLSEVYEVVGLPHLIRDLGFEDRMILANSHDKVLLPKSDYMERLWNALDGYDLRLRSEVVLPPRFEEPEEPELVTSSYKKISEEEGKKRLKLAMQSERASKAAKEAKERNRVANGGRYKCEGCALEDKVRGLFDAHHLQPLSLGPRVSTPDSYAILCALCHRTVHYKTSDRLVPLPIAELRELLRSSAISGAGALALS